MANWESAFHIKDLFTLDQLDKVYESLEPLCGVMKAHKLLYTHTANMLSKNTGLQISAKFMQYWK